MPVPALESDATGAVPIRLVQKADLAAALAGLPAAQRRWAEAQGFSGALGEALCLPAADGSLAAVLAGWGDAAARARTRFCLAGTASRLPPGRYRLDTALPAAEAEEAALGWLLEAYRFDAYRKAEARERGLVCPEGVDAERLAAIAEAVCLGRDLVNTPACDMGPAALEAAVRRVAARFGAEVTVTAGEDLIGANLPLIHAVGRAAAQAPRLIDLHWGRADAPRVTLVGKGVCFDTGGLDIKPSASMRLMKKDMGGAAAALATAQMVMARRLDVRLRLLIPAVENAIAGNSFRPGDILRSRKGLTVEIGNTDAEGRLVLADALTLAVEDGAGTMIDFATLTGAARVALGPDLPPLYTDDAALAADLLAAGDLVADPMWRLPLWPPYEEDIRSPVADLDNAPGGGMAGSITAALFLKRFAEGAPAWAHLDIYGWNPKARPGRPKGGEAQAARAVFAMLEARHA
jgi:leucyl aminopeptidase